MGKGIVWLTHTIYGLHSGDGVIRYVGATRMTMAQRLGAHTYKAKNGQLNPSFGAWMAEIGFYPEVIILESSVKDYESAERFWIKLLRHHYPLVNATDGGLGAPGMRHSDSAKAKLSAYFGGPDAPNRGRKQSKEMRRKLSASTMGLRRGESNGYSVMNPEKVHKVRALLAEGYTLDQVAAVIGVSKGCISSIKMKRTWGWLD